MCSSRAIFAIAVPGKERGYSWADLNYSQVLYMTPEPNKRLIFEILDFDHEMNAQN